MSREAVADHGARHSHAMWSTTTLGDISPRVAADHAAWRPARTLPREAAQLSIHYWPEASRVFDPTGDHRDTRGPSSSIFVEPNHRSRVEPRSSTSNRRRGQPIEVEAIQRRLGVDRPDISTSNHRLDRLTDAALCRSQRRSPFRRPSGASNRPGRFWPVLAVDDPGSILPTAITGFGSARQPRSSNRPPARAGSSRRCTPKKKTRGARVTPEKKASPREGIDPPPGRCLWISFARCWWWCPL
jgi:hypothetical protein